MTKGAANKHIRPHSGAIRCDHLRPHHVSAWVTSQAQLIQDGKNAPGTYNHHLTVLRVIVAWARHPAQAFLAHDPLIGVRRIPKVPKRVKPLAVLTPEETTALIQAAVPPHDTEPGWDVLLPVLGTGRASRALIHWDLRESMKEQEVECILERAKELYPEARPRIISDNGPQFVAKDFKEFIRISGMTHVRISPYYPQSNGKIERWHQTTKGDALRPAQPATLEDARQIIARFVEHYNGVRLHSALGYVAPLAFMAGQAPAITFFPDPGAEEGRSAVWK